MTTTIAVSGKGGSGKTTIASMIVRTLLERSDSGPILCIDADPNACLGLALGVPPGATVAEIREQARAKTPQAGGMDRVHMVEYGFQQAITEAGRFDLVTMGRPEGPSCYCAVNNLLRRILDELSSKYRFVVIDNEAGMEHLSRRTTNHVDLLCIVSEPTSVGALTARRIYELAKKLPIVVKEIGVLWNKMDGECLPTEELSVLARVPEDALVLEASRRGADVFALTDQSPAFQTVRAMVGRLVAMPQMKQIPKHESQQVLEDR
ncbi:MAG: AAA family ATPase [Actinobacteria bacterium]|nr:AAA family ATPase [Actinomycetota bacterium]